MTVPPAGWVWVCAALHSKFPEMPCKMAKCRVKNAHSQRCVCVMCVVVAKNYCTFAVLTGWLFGFLCLVVSIYGKLLKFHSNLFPRLCSVFHMFSFGVCVCECVFVIPHLSDLNVCVISLNFSKTLWLACQFMPEICPECLSISVTVTVIAED